jgi:hypothetical protein
MTFLVTFYMTNGLHKLVFARPQHTRTEECPPEMITSSLDKLKRLARSL